jgi:hypothetical protein
MSDDQLQELHQLLKPVLEEHGDSPPEVLAAALDARMAELRAAGVRWPSRSSPEALRKLDLMLAERLIAWTEEARAELQEMYPDEPPSVD